MLLAVTETVLLISYGMAVILTSGSKGTLDGIQAIIPLALFVLTPIVYLLMHYVIAGVFSRYDIFAQLVLVMCVLVNIIAVIVVLGTIENVFL